MALGGICGSLLGGYALNNMEIDKIFVLFSVLPSIQLLSCGSVKESSVRSKSLPEFTTSNGSHIMNENLLDEDKFSAEKSKTGTSRRKKSKKTKKNGKKKVVITSKVKIPENDESFPLRWFHSLKIASSALFRAFRQPIILR